MPRQTRYYDHGYSALGGSALSLVGNLAGNLVKKIAKSDLGHELS